jgi:hypothetical protein
MQMYNTHRRPQRDQDEPNLCSPAGKAETMRSVHVSGDIWDDKKTALRQNQRDADHPPGCWSGAIGACGRMVLKAARVASRFASRCEGG